MSLLDIFSYLQLSEQSLENEQKIGCCEKEVRESVQRWEVVRSGAICTKCNCWTTLIPDEIEQICDGCGREFYLRKEGRIAFVTVLKDWVYALGFAKLRVRFVDDREGYVLVFTAPPRLKVGASYLVPYAREWELKGERHIDVYPDFEVVDL